MTRWLLLGLMCYLLVSFNRSISVRKIVCSFRKRPLSLILTVNGKYVRVSSPFSGYHTVVCLDTLVKQWKIRVGMAFTAAKIGTLYGPKRILERHRCTSHLGEWWIDTEFKGGCHELQGTVKEFARWNWRKPRKSYSIHLLTRPKFEPNTFPLQEHKLHLLAVCMVWGLYFADWKWTQPN
jgi:hypothetical protein